MFLQVFRLPGPHLPARTTQDAADGPYRKASPATDPHPAQPSTTGKACLSSPEKILEVPNSSFIPEPEVTSEVIKLNIRDSKAVSVKDENLLFKIIKCAFMQRRKTLLNSLCNSKVFPSKDEGIKILNILGFSPNVRAENLTLDDFGKIADLLC